MNGRETQEQQQTAIMKRLEQHLAVPYLMEIESVELDDGVWVRRVAYPELLGCTIDADQGDIESAIEELEWLRVREIARLVAGEEGPGITRSPLAAPVLFLSEPLPDVVAEITRSIRQ